MTTYPIKTAVNTDKQQADKVISLEDVSKRYPMAKKTSRDIEGDFKDFWALKDICLDIHSGEILGIIGRNGAGKTTLLNIIAGVLFPTKGKISTKGRILGLFNLGVGFSDELTGRENIFLNGVIMGSTRKELENRFDSIVEFSELGNFIEMPLGTYSQGMRLRLGFSILVNLHFDILVIDEVLAVGDTLFQSKCFECLMDFRRSGKTLIITSQNMDLIERLCDRAALLDHGRLLFCGDIIESIEKYRLLLNTEKFFVGPQPIDTSLIQNTKRWADDTVSWGRKLGTKQVVIERVDLLNRLGLRCSQVRSGQRLKIKVYFRAKDNIQDPHFGIAIFSNDGVYCYGPNTKFDRQNILELKPGDGYFALDFHKLLLAPGEYRISVAIWDKNEKLAFNYHEGCYKLTVIGDSDIEGEILNIPFIFHGKYCKNKKRNKIDLSTLNDKWGKKIETEQAKIESVKLLNNLGQEKDVFMTNESVKLIASFKNLTNWNKNSLFWVGLYRDDGVYCQGIIREIHDKKIIKIAFPKLPLLPGGYRISLGVWDVGLGKFIISHHGVYFFRMVFNKQDHGTIYLEHTWHKKLPF